MRGWFPKFLSGLMALPIVVAGCSPAADNATGTSDQRETVTVTVRLWDEQLAKAYENSFAEFETQHDEIDVKVELVPPAEYFTVLPQDVASGQMADIFWVNTSSFGLYADNGDLINVGDELREQKSGWKKSVVDLYTRDGALWGVPQLWDSIALYYNKDLVRATGVNPASLTWDVGKPSDTFLPAVQKLTVDENGKTADQTGFVPAKTRQFGFNASLDGQAIYPNFVASNGGVLQEGDRFAMSSPETVAAMQYVVDLINKFHVAPPAADTNQNPDKARDLFIQGKLALFQSGPYNLKNIEAGADFEWGIAPLVAGPKGRVSLVHGVAAVGYSKSRHPEETIEVLKWMGSLDGQKPIAAGGYAFPGVLAAEPLFADYWSKRNVDIKPFIEASEGVTFPAPLGPKAQAGGIAMYPVLQEMFLGRKTVRSGLAEAEKLANAAIAER